MPGYDADEIETAVSKLVKSSLTTRRDPLGPSDLSAAFSDVLQLLSSTLLSYPTAIFYLIYLATNKLNKSVESVISDLDDLLEAVDETFYRTQEVTHSSLLSDAATALADVDSILTSKGSVSTQALSRYTNAISKFTEKDLAPNIKHSSQITRPAPLAKSDAKDLLISLETDYPALLTDLAQVQSMLSEFLALNLGATSMQASIRNVRSDLESLSTYYNSDAYTRDAKVSSTRDAYLTLTAGKAVLTGMVSLVDPREPLLASSTTVKGYAAVAQGGGKTTPATVLGTKSGPWTIIPGTNDELSILEDLASTPTTYTLTPPAYPSVASAKGVISSGSYDIHPQSNAYVLGNAAASYTITAPNVVFTVYATGSAVKFSGNLTPGTYSGADMVTEILSKLTGLSTYANVSYTTGLLITHVSSGAKYSVSVGEDTNNANTSLGFPSGSDWSGVGQDANNQLQIDSGNVLTLATNSATTIADLIAQVDAYDQGTYPVGTYVGSQDTVDVDGTTWYFLKITKQVSGAEKIILTVPSGSAGDPVRGFYTTLGFYEGQSDTADAMSAAEVAEAINSVGLISASVKRTTYEAGNDGTITSATTLTVPSGIDTSVVHVDDQLLLKIGTSAGYHRIVGITPGSPILIVVSADTPFSYSGSPESNQSWSILREVVQLSSILTGDLRTKLDIRSADANSTLGLTVAVNYGTTTGFASKDSTTGKSSSFSQAKVQAKDVLSIISGTTTTYTVSEVDTAGDQIELTAAISTNVSAVAFKINSASSVAYSGMDTSLSDWTTNTLGASKFKTDIKELARLMNILLTPTRPTQSQKSDVVTALTGTYGMKTILEDLSTILKAYAVGAVSRIDAALSMLTERSLDKAYDLLLSGYIKTVFSMSKDDATHSSYMLKTMRSIVQSDLAYPSSDEDADDSQHLAGYSGTDADYDTSDKDSDENVSILGEVAYYSENDKTSSSKRQ